MKKGRCKGLKYFKRNHDGHSVPEVTKLAGNQEPDRDERRFRKLLKMIFSLCEIAGFDLVERVVLRDKRSGRIWK